MFVPKTTLALVVSHLAVSCCGLKYTPEFVDYNLNTNENTSDPLEYSGKWEDHTFHPSPDQWRMPFYTLFLDRYVNGDPSNDNANGTVFEQDVMGTQLRFGGDIQGLADSLDYIQGFGIKALYVAGSPFINQPWGSDAYSPLDHTLLDQHFGNITVWRQAITEIHARGMYIILDNTVATMGDLVGFKGYLNKSAPYVPEHEHQALWKAANGRRYHDFNFGTTFNATCENFPRLYWANGSEAQDDVYDTFGGCYDGEFDQFGDTEAFGVYADYRRQMTKFASVQDRLREWVPSVRQKLINFSCLTIQMLDIDGFRYDKATQSTVDALGEFSAAMRECAREVNKTNFFIPGEITGGNTFGSLYLGRGRQPDQYLDDIETAVNLTSATAANKDIFIRDAGQNPLDGAAFHYSIYRNLLRFLGMDGDMSAAYDVSVDFTTAWNTMILSNDMLNAETGAFDPRHMYGASNQDVFRWPSITYGIERNLLGLFITTLHMPGIPLLLWGEEQAFYVLDNTASNYMFGRQPIAASPAWQAHGCYSLLPATLYFDMPLNASLTGCQDDTVSYDHRDPSHPIRNVIKHMYFLRNQYPVLTDGFYLRELSKQTETIYLPGSSGVGTETGIWSVMRNQFLGIQDLGENATQIWMVYHNLNESRTYTFECDNSSSALLAPFDTGTTVKNLFFPHDELNLTASTEKLGINGSTEYNGCSDSITLSRFEFRAYVPVDFWVPPPPMITKFLPGHDTRHFASGDSISVNVSLHFNVEMDQDYLIDSINFTSSTASSLSPSIDTSTVQCGSLSDTQPDYAGIIATAWGCSFNVTNLAPGIHQMAVHKPLTADKGSSTDAVDRFLLRVGALDHPLVFPTSANYSSSMLNKSSDGTMTLTHSAPGANSYRYSTNWGSTYSSWLPYEAETTITELSWNGTTEQEWKGTHVIVQYWNQLVGSSSYVVQADADYSGAARRFPHLFASGPFNEYGYDSGLDNEIKHTGESFWQWHYMDEWPAYFEVSVWGMNPDGLPDESFIYGDIDSDGVLERMPPSSLIETVVNITSAPPKPHLAYRFVIQDSTLKYGIVPVGSMWAQLILYILLWIVPIISALAVVEVFRRSFYKIKYNEIGVTQGSTVALLARRAKRTLFNEKVDTASRLLIVPGAGVQGDKRRKVLIATMEYNIDDWGIKIKIGGLGVMAQLMGTALKHQDLIWVVPCAGGIDYPIDTPAEPMYVKVMGQFYEVQVQYHKLENITFVLLDAPVFRKQTKAEPYPPRMDDMESAVYYSAWNQCIAETIKRFPVDLYHINDYHGACAPLYLLPKTIPAALSLHNAEFQGMWPMRTPEESKEVCDVFNLSEQVVKDYVQFGSVFNLLHAGASYLRIHQQGFGAVGVSKKYGDRSFARYPIFWGLSKVGQLPNPDPTDTGEFDLDAITGEKPTIDQEFEAARSDLKRQAQEWAGLEQNPNAELFVFVGRWSLQKGVDLIADIFPWVLEQYPQTQLICIGPMIDLYGRFAALKLAKLMEKYPGRVFSKPEFTALPPYIFSGAEFALIPSRDEPFGLVAVEFGRKGALGVGARVGGLGQMPGWWYTVESTKASHLLDQFKHAIVAALKSDPDKRALMRAYSAKQRFPVAQWLAKLEKLQNSVIKLHDKNVNKPRKGFMASTKNLLISPSKEDFGAEIQLQDQRPAWVHSVTDFGGDASRIPSMYNTPSPSRPGTPGFESYSPGPSTPAPTFSPGHDRTESAQSFSRPFAQHQRADSEQSSMLAAPRPFFMQNESSRLSVLSLDEIVGERHDYKLQKVDPFFTDKDGEFYSVFEKKLSDLDAHNSISELCIEDYLLRSEKEWFNEYRDVRLGRGRSPAPGGDRSRAASANRSRSPNPNRRSMLGLSFVSGHRSSRMSSARASMDEPAGSGLDDDDDTNSEYEAFEIPRDYVPPTGLKKYLQYQIGDWPIYAILLAISQVIASNSYQITLLTGSVGEPASKLYVVASIYLASTIVWYVLSRTVPLLYPLAIPFVFYGAAFTILGFSPLASDSTTQGWIQNVATGFYAFASSSGGITFAFNFGTDGGSTVSSWIMRLAIIQGVSQLYTLGLWAWGATVSATVADGGSESIANSPVLLAVCLPIAVFLWLVGGALYLGLPDFYRETPGPVPQLWKTLLKRKTIAWYLLAVIIQNYFLSAVYGRNWFFLFASTVLSTWSVVLLALGFFVVMWCIILFVLARFSESHPWLFPMFAVGLGAPRWAQMFWGVSRIGLWLPWAGGAVASAIVSRLVWLWLGLLDGIQGAGIGMILMLTLTRVHVAAAIIAAQALGSIATIAARASAPDKLGPGPVFPDLSKGVGAVVGEAWFWVVLLLNLGICFGYFKFFRKEQVSKP